MLDRTFEAAAPNRKWIAGFTYVWTAEGWLYVAAVVDLFYTPSCKDLKPWNRKLARYYNPNCGY